MELQPLSGNEPAKIDDKGRLKIPNYYRNVFQARGYGNAVFVTSLTGESVLVYPIPVWLEREQALRKAPTSHSAVRKYIERTSYYGQVAELDSQGRLLIQPRLREAAQMSGQLAVLGKLDHLELWNNDRLEARVKAPWTSDDDDAISTFGF